MNHMTKKIINYYLKFKLIYQHILDMFHSYKFKFRICARNEKKLYLLNFEEQLIIGNNNN